MSLLSFHNAFDDVTVGLSDESPVVDGQITNAGPFEITVTHGPDSMGDAPITETYATLTEAKAAFFARMNAEFDAVL